MAQQVWNAMLIKGNFSMKKLYFILIKSGLQVPWRFLFKGNMARPRVIMWPGLFVMEIWLPKIDSVISR